MEPFLLYRSGPAETSTAFFCLPLNSAAGAYKDKRLFLLRIFHMGRGCVAFRGITGPLVIGIQRVQP